MKLDLGAGYIRRNDFLRVDIDKKCSPDIWCDIRYLKPVKDNSIIELYTSHTLEHILHKDLFETLRNFNRVLKPGGKLTIVVPDVLSASKDWINNKIDSRIYEVIVLGVNPTATKHMLHKNIFYPFKLRRYLAITGFVDTKVKSHNHHYDLIATATKPRESKHA